jgi:hypothetical protein
MKLNQNMLKRCYYDVDQYVMHVLPWIVCLWWNILNLSLVHACIVFSNASGVFSFEITDLLPKSNGMLLPENVSVFQWYFTEAGSFSCIFRRSWSFSAMRSIFHKKIYLFWPYSRQHIFTLPRAVLSPSGRLSAKTCLSWVLCQE